MGTPVPHIPALRRVALLFTISAIPVIMFAQGRNPVELIPVGYSYSRPSEVAIKHLDLTLSVDFRKRVLRGRASYEIDNTKRVSKLILDTRDLNIVTVTLGRGNAPTGFELGRSDTLLGAPLLISISPETQIVTIDYTTSPHATALQWLRPEQTFGKKLPFMYTESEPIQARSWLPCQDIPSVRLTYRATVKVPPGMLAIMSAVNPQAKNSRGVYELDMPQPIAPYLIALAVGDIEFRATGKRTGVYAEPSMALKSARELSSLERMVAVAESLCGPYRWGRYDVLVLPPAYPVGGMENPRLTFATPTIIVGDKSLTNLINHELAHSWSGNLVTNASWNDIWLNEGITTYLERRITEALHGREFADMESAVERHDLDELMRRLGPTNPETQLFLDMGGSNPNNEGRQVVYEKGALFLRAVEEAAGRRRVDAFLRTYFDRFAYQSITTSQFVTYYRDTFAKRDSVLNARVNVDAWIFRPGIPSGAPKVGSRRLEIVDAQLLRWQAGSDPHPLKTSGWTTFEWVHFLQMMPDSLSATAMGRLDIAFGFTGAQNDEILSVWLLLAIRHHYQPAFQRLETFLKSTGRIKYIFPLYRALTETEEGAALGREIFRKARSGYHPLVVNAVSRVLAGR